jgi:hypothetical protein
MCTGHTHKNGAVLFLFTIKTAPFFCVYSVYLTNVVTLLLNEMLRWFKEPSTVLHFKMDEVVTGVRSSGGGGGTAIAICRYGEELQI